MYCFYGDRAKRRKELKKNRKWNCFYSQYNLHDLIMKADQMRPKEEFDLPTRYYNQYEEMLTSILSKKYNDSEMPYSHAECKFIIYLLVAYISDTEELYKQIDRVFQMIQVRRLQEEIEEED